MVWFIFLGSFLAWLSYKLDSHGWVYSCLYVVNFLDQLWLKDKCPISFINMHFNSIFVLWKKHVFVKEIGHIYSNNDIYTRDIKPSNMHKMRQIYIVMHTHIFTSETIYRGNWQIEELYHSSIQQTPFIVVTTVISNCNSLSIL